MKIALSLVTLGLCSLSAARLAQAQGDGPMPVYVVVAERPQSEHERPLAAPSNALELSAGSGYTQGFGNLRSGVGMPSVASPGVAVDIGVGYRIDESWAILWSGEYAQLTPERTNAARSLTTGLAMQYHFAPLQRVDPWAEVGAGYRFLIEDPSVGSTLVTHGPQLGRIRAGIDFRIAETLALGPMIGADATFFAFQDIPGLPTVIQSPTVSAFVFGGLMGRFDIGQTTSSRRRPVIIPAAAFD